MVSTVSGMISTGWGVVRAVASNSITTLGATIGKVATFGKNFFTTYIPGALSSGKALVFAYPKTAILVGLTAVGLIAYRYFSGQPAASPSSPRPRPAS